MLTRIFLQAGELAADYDFDDALIDFNSSNPLLVDILPTALTVKADFNSSIDLNFSRDDGSLIGTAFNGAGIVSGKLNIPATAYVRWQGTDNLSQAAQQGCIGFYAYPGYSGNPSARSVIFWGVAGVGDNRNLIELDHEANGHIMLYFFNSSAVPVFSVDLGLWVPVINQEYIFSLNWNGAVSIGVGATRLFINGTQFGSTITTAFTRSNVLGLMQFSFPGLAWLGKIDNFYIFDEVQHTADYIPAIVSRYTTTNPTINSIDAVNASAIDAFTFNGNEPTGTNLTFVLTIDGIDMWFDGAAWVESSGYAESNSSINSDQLALLDLGGLASIVPKFFLNSDGDDTPQLLNYTIVYIGQGYATITGQFLNSDNTVPLEGYVIVAPEMVTFPDDTNIAVSTRWQKITIDSDTGDWSVTKIIGVVYYFYFYFLNLQNQFELDTVSKRFVNVAGDVQFNELPESE